MFVFFNLLSRILKFPLFFRKRLSSGKPCESHVSFAPYAVFSSIEDFIVQYPRLLSSFEDALNVLNRNDKIFCTVCNSKENFSYNTSSLRETLLCNKCKLNTRMRLIFTLFKQELGARDKEHLVVYCMEAVTPFAQALKTYVKNCKIDCLDLYFSEYLGPEFLPGEVTREGIMHQDVCNLSFSDNTIDIIISQDVMEHVYNYKKGFQEIYRVLKPEGICLMTIPFHCNKEKTKERVQIIDGKLKYLEEPEYHFSPQGKSLVFTDFGWDLLNFLRDIGFNVTLEYYLEPRFGFVQEPCSLVWRLKKQV